MGSLGGQGDETLMNGVSALIIKTQVRPSDSFNEKGPSVRTLC